MAAVFGAFAEYLLTFIFYVIVAGAGIFAGKTLLKRSREKEAGAAEASKK